VDEVADRASRAERGGADSSTPPVAAGSRTTGTDLASYLRVHAPMPPYRAAVFVSALADQIAALHAEGRTVGPLRAGVRVETDGWHRPVIVRPGVSGAACRASDDVAQVGLLLAGLLGAPAGVGPRLPPRPEAVPAQLWSLVTDSVHRDTTARPTAAVLARRLRDTARDLLLDVVPTPSPGEATTTIGISPVPDYVPGRDLEDGSKPAPRSRAALGRVVLVATMGTVILGAGATTVFALIGQPGSAPPPTPPPTGAPPPPVQACAPPGCAARVTVEPGGRLVVCDNSADGLSGVAVVTGPALSEPMPVWASEGNGTCEDKDLPVPAGTAITVEPCTGERPANRIERCGEIVAATA
jgi:hypothetical protein